MALIRGTPTRKKRKIKDEIMVGLFEKLNPDRKICEIPATNTKPKENVFIKMRPKPGHCLDYSISQTDAQLDAGPTKIKLQQTRASYVPVPPEQLPVEKVVRKKNYFFTGGPPCWEFVDEKWRRQVEEQQAIAREELKRRLKENKKKKRDECRYMKARLEKKYKK